MCGCLSTANYARGLLGTKGKKKLKNIFSKIFFQNKEIFFPKQNFLWQITVFFFQKNKTTDFNFFVK